VLLVAGIACRAGETLPPALDEALASVQRVELYSLEPWADRKDNAPRGRLHGFKVLGHAVLDGSAAIDAAAAFRTAVAADNDAVAACFDPRHALRVVVGEHVYDLLLCYACGQLEVFDGDHHLAWISASGSSDDLDRLLGSSLVPLSTTDTVAQRDAAAVAHAEVEERWIAAMPASIRADFTPNVYPVRPDEAKLARALVAQWPDTSERIRHLFRWYGSGAGPWSGYPEYETVAEHLLLAYPTRELVAAIDEAPDERLREGAARLFAGWDFRTLRPDDATLIPAPLKAALLRHVRTFNPGLESWEATDRLESAERAFGPSRHH
jgi:hypothetical protein